MRTLTPSFVLLCAVGLTGCPPVATYRPCSDLTAIRTELAKTPGDGADPQSPFVLGYQPFCAFLGDAQVAKALHVMRFVAAGMKAADGSYLTNVRVESGGLVADATGPNGAPRTLRGRDLVDARLSVELSNGVMLDGFRIADVTPANPDPSEFPGTEIAWRYQVVYSRDGKTWSPPLCQVAADRPDTQGGAIALAESVGNDGSVSQLATYFSLSCGMGAVAECARWGYHTPGPDQRERYQACIRMARADYCGNGVDHTCAGTQIRYWPEGASAPDGGAAAFEAAWSENGAVCGGHLRWQEQKIWGCPLLAVPCTLAEAPSRADPSKKIRVYNASVSHKGACPTPGAAAPAYDPNTQ